MQRELTSILKRTTPIFLDPWKFTFHQYIDSNASFNIIHSKVSIINESIVREFVNDRTSSSSTPNPRIHSMLSSISLLLSYPHKAWICNIFIMISEFSASIVHRTASDRLSKLGSPLMTQFL